MKKWLCALSVCAVAGLGMFGFSGCATGNDEVKFIKIKTMPSTTEFVVGDVITPALKDGVFTVQYSSGRTADMSLNHADIVYVDYADGTTSNEFNQPASNQVVVVRYKSKTTTFNVSVAKQDLELDYQKSYQKSYTGAHQSVGDILSLGLPEGAYVSKIEYREFTPDGTGQYNAVPVSAGKYDVRVTINGGVKYNELVLDDIIFEIKKADLNYVLRTPEVHYGDIFMNYGDKVDASRNWQIGASEGDIFANALKGSYVSLAPYMQYAYRAESSHDYTILGEENSNVWLSNLPAGHYKLRAYVRDAQNVADFYFESNLVVAAKELVYGVDYKILVSDGANSIEYVLPNDPMDIVTTIRTSSPKDVRVQLVLLNDRAKAALKSTPVITYVHSQSDLANWNGQGATTPIAYGDYKICISAEFSGDVCYLDKTFHGIKIVEE